MPATQINPYLNFGGTAAKAISFYEKALGAKTESVQNFGSVPGMDVKPEDRERVMHATLRIGGSVIMLSDGPPGKSVPTESNIWISLNYEDATEMAGQFDALAAGGQVVMALQDTFWGAKFGMLTDAFHINWMFNCHTKK